MMDSFLLLGERFLRAIPELEQDVMENSNRYLLEKFAIVLDDFNAVVIGHDADLLVREVLDWP